MRSLEWGTLFVCGEGSKGSESCDEGIELVVVVLIYNSFLNISLVISGPICKVGLVYYFKLEFRLKNN